MSLEELIQYPSYLKGEWNYSLLISFPTNGEKQIIEIDGISLKGKQFVDTAARIKRS